MSPSCEDRIARGHPVSGWVRTPPSLLRLGHHITPDRGNVNGGLRTEGAMEFTIRPAQAQDAAFLADGWRAMIDELDMAPAGFVPGWRERLASFFASGLAAGAHGWFVACSPDGTPVGCAAAMIAETTLVQVEPTATIAGVYVAPAFRRRGMARDLTQAAIAWARRRGCRQVRLVASPQAEPLYRSLGFTDGRELILTLT